MTNKLAVVLGTAITCMSSVVSAATYVIQDSSYMTLMGSEGISISISGIGPTLLGSSGTIFNQQAADSLRTVLSGVLDATTTGNTLTITPSSTVIAENNGNWEPYGYGANIGARTSHEVTIAVDGPADDIFFKLDFLYAFRNFSASFDGTATLSNPAKFRIFSTKNFGMKVTGGVVDAFLTVSSEGISDSSYDVGELNGIDWYSWDLQGSILNNGVTETISFQFSLSANELTSESEPIDGVPGAMITVEHNFRPNLFGVITAVRPVPEPETWAMLVAGVCLVGLFARQRR